MIIICKHENIGESQKTIQEMAKLYQNLYQIFVRNALWLKTRQEQQHATATTTTQQLGKFRLHRFSVSLCGKWKLLRN